MIIINNNRFVRIIVFVILILSSLSIFYLDNILPEIDIILPYILIIFISVWFLGNKIGLFFFIFNNTLWISSKLYSIIKPGLIIYTDMVIKIIFILIQYFIIVKLQKLYLEVKELALTDSLTGLYNRRGFYYLLEYLLVRVNREQKSVTLIYIDIDNFKSENDKRGHREGDRILKTLGEIIVGTTRDTDITARMGGDEFCIFIYDTDHAEIKSIVDRIAGHFQILCKDNRWVTTLSMGVFTTSDFIDLNDLIEQGDRLMYQAKKEGKKRVVFEKY